MGTKSAYMQKMEAELELIQANIAVLVAKAKNATADARIEYDHEISKMNHGYNALQTKLSELGKAGEEGWESFKSDIESNWDSLRAYIKGFSEKNDLSEKVDEGAQSVEEKTKKL